MQPYLFPYIGYFQLINSVDKFIFLDDVNFINKGWINRNRLIFSGSVSYFSLALKQASQNKKIEEIDISEDSKLLLKLERSIKESYKKAPFFSEAYPILESRLFLSDLHKISEIAKLSVLDVMKFLDIKTTVVQSSSLYENQNLTGQDRILDICLKEGAAEYINLPGGNNLYDRNFFKNQGIELSFIKPNIAEYKNFSVAFEPALSIIDLMMHVPCENIKEMINA